MKHLKELKRPVGFPNTNRSYASLLLEKELTIVLAKSRSINPDVISGTFTSLLATMFAASLARADEADRAQTLDDMIEIIRTETELKVNEMLDRKNRE